MNPHCPGPQGLYDPCNEHDGCGIGVIAGIKGVKSHEIVSNGIEILIQIPHAFFARECPALEFTGPVREGLVSQLGAECYARGNVRVDKDWSTSVPGVFCAGDMQRGQSLVVWAIAAGRKTGKGVSK